MNKNKSGNLIVHGGRGTLSSFLGDIHLFDCKRLRWKQVDTSRSYRHDFGMQVTADGIIVVYGGLDENQIASDALLTIDHSHTNLSWTYHDSRETAWPGARYSHGMCICGDHQIAVFGGHDSLGNRLCDLWLLDTHKLASNKAGEKLWAKVKPESCIRPKVRASPSIAHLDGKIYLFGRTARSRGEVESFDLTSCTWERQVSCGEEPLEQDCQVHSLEKAMKLVTICNEESSSCGMFNRLDILDIQTKPITWSKVDLSWYGDWTMIPGTRRCFASRMDSSEGLLYVFGGVQENSQTDVEGPDLLSTLIIANFSRHNHSTEDMDG